MEYPCRIGMETIPEDIMTRFEGEAHEYLLAVGGGSFFNNPFRMGGVYVLEILENGPNEANMEG